MRRRYVYDELHDKMVEVTQDWTPEVEVKGPLVMPDVKPFKSMMSGKIINSRSQHRDELRQYDCMEVGNETAYMVKNRVRQEPAPGIREALMRAAYKHGILKP